MPTSLDFLRGDAEIKERPVLKDRRYMDVDKLFASLGKAGKL